MQITPNYEMTMDIDWYALDPEGAIAHFATGGKGFLPASSSGSMEDLDAVWEFLEKAPAITCAAVTEQGTRAAARSLVSVEFALRDFVGNASRGVYSYDTVSLKQRFSPYYLVAAPERPLHISDVPEGIRRILERTRSRVAFRTTTLLNSEDISSEQ